MSLPWSEAYIQIYFRYSHTNAYIKKLLCILHDAAVVQQVAPLLYKSTRAPVVSMLYYLSEFAWPSHIHVTFLPSPTNMPVGGMVT